MRSLSRNDNPLNASGVPILELSGAQTAVIDKSGIDGFLLQIVYPAGFAGNVTVASSSNGINFDTISEATTALNGSGGSISLNFPRGALTTKYLKVSIPNTSSTTLYFTAEPKE